MLPSRDHTPTTSSDGIKGETRVAGSGCAFDPDIDVVRLLVADIHGDAAAVGRKRRIRHDAGLTDAAQVPCPSGPSR